MNKNRMEEEDQIVCRSEEEEEREYSKNKKERLEEVNKRRRELKPRLRERIKELEVEKKLVNDHQREMWYSIYSKNISNRKEAMLGALRIWPTKEEACRITGYSKEEMDEIVIRTSEEEEEKISIVRQFIEDMTGKKLHEWNEGIEILMNRGEYVTQINIQYPFKTLGIRNGAGNLISIKRVSRQKRVIRKYSRINRVGDMKEEEILVFTGNNTIKNNEEVVYIIYKNQCSVDSMNEKIRFKILEIADINYELLDTEEMIRRTERKEKEVEEVDSMINRMRSENGGVRELVYRYKIFKEIMRKKSEIEKEVQCELYLGMEASQREILMKKEIEIDTRPDFLCSYIKV